MASFVEDAYKELAECSICTDIYNEPKMLPCLHTFCLECLTTYGKGKQPGASMPCPICRKEFQVPKDGFAGLKSNFIINRIKELYIKAAKVTTAPKVVVLCAACGFGNDGETKSTSVENFCVDCQQKLCQKCCTLHKQFAVSKMHQIVPINAGDESSLKELLKIRTSPCNQHPDQKVQLYCLSCKEAICLLCFALNHSTHTCDSIEKIAEKERNLISSDLEALSKRLAMLEKHEDEVKQRKLDVLKSVEEADLQINKTAQKLIELINSHKQKAIQELKEKQQIKMKVIAQHLSDLDTEKCMLETCKQFSNTLRENGTDAEVAQFTKDVHDKAKQLLEKELMPLPSASSVRILFQLSCAIPTMQKEFDNLVGTLTHCEIEERKQVEKQVERNISKTKPEKPSKTFLTKIPGTGCILGIAALESKIFVCRIRSSKVDVFSTDSYTKLQTFTIQGLKDPTDMASCSVTKRIYVNGQEDFCIFQVNTDGKVIGKWQMKDKAFRISVDTNGYVTVTFREALYLRVYGSDGSLLTRINLSPDIRSPRNALLVNGVKFVICHGELGESLHRVCELEEDGTIVQWYGESEGSSPSLLNVPVHLIRAPENRYLVADLNNQRVHLIQNFKLVTHLLTASDGIKIPRKLELYEDKLFVAQDDGAVLVFGVTF